MILRYWHQVVKFPATEFKNYRKREGTSKITKRGVLTPINGRSITVESVTSRPPADSSDISFDHGAFGLTMHTSKQ